MDAHRFLPSASPAISTTWAARTSPLISSPRRAGSFSSTRAFQASVPLIRKSVESLGFHFSDIKILLISHAHDDHCAGSAANHPTHRRKVLRHGWRCIRRSNPAAEPTSNTARKKPTHYPPAHVDRVLHDGSIGQPRRCSAHRASHARPHRGTTTWTMDETENGRLLHVVIVGSPNVNPGYKLVGNKTYPQIASDYKRGFAVLDKLPCDIFLGAHGSYFDLTEKYPRWKAGEQECLHRSRRLQGLYCRSRAGIRGGARPAIGRAKIIKSQSSGECGCTRSRF